MPIRKFPKDSIITSEQRYSLPTRKVHIYPPLKRVEIRLYWESGATEGSVAFNSVHHFAEFLRDNPELAQAVEYVPKAKQ